MLERSPSGIREIFSFLRRSLKSFETCLDQGNVCKAFVVEDEEVEGHHKFHFLSKSRSCILETTLLFCCEEEIDGHDELFITINTHVNFTSCKSKS